MKKEYNFPGDYIKTSCNLCKECYRHPEHNHCMFGGPFKHYLILTEKSSEKQVDNI